MAAGQSSKWSEQLCVKNYDSGAVFTESYANAEHLQKQTEVKTATSDPDSCYGGGNLEASVSSSFIGEAHIGWLSVEPTPMSGGRHLQIGQSVEDLVGIFSVDKYIQLWGNSSAENSSIDWVPCV